MPQNTGISPSCFDSLGVYRVMWVATGGGMLVRGQALIDAL